MGDVQVDYCLNQTKLSTIFCTNNYLGKVISMKKKGIAQYVTNMVLFDGLSNEPEKKQAEELGIRVLTLDEVMEAGKNSEVALEPEKV